MYETPVASRVLRPGAQLGRYTVVNRIGCGGMAELYLARAEGVGGFEKALALKVVHAHLVQEESALRMFLREARVAATLEHPNVVTVHDVGVFGGEHVLVMEYVHGRDVGQILRCLPKDQVLPMGCGLRIVLDVCAALDYVHTKTDPQGHPLGLVHRDVSPANVLVAFNGAVKLVDFGIVKMTAQTSTTKTGSLKGKFGYMSPEQSMGEDIDARSDVFALGVLLYEVTTGRRAFAGDNAFTIMNRVIEGEYVRPHELVLGYPDPLSAIIERALEVDPGQRYPSAKAMLVDLESYVATAGVTVGRSSVAEYVRSLFGDPSYPDVSAVMHTQVVTEARYEETNVRHTSSVVRRPRTQMGMIAAGALGLGVAAGWYVGVDARTPLDDTPNAPSNVDESPTATANTEDAPSTVETVLVPPPLPEQVEEPEVEAEAVGPTSETQSTLRRSRPKRRRVRRVPRNGKADDVQDPLDSMFPRSMK
jgi:eukaryotic-like serine/threonine-protein kinase